jgi:hypothetical protein
MINGSKPCGPSGGFRARIQSGDGQDCGVLFPSPQPSPEGEGETFSRALVTRLSSVARCLREERQSSGDCNRNIRVFQYTPSVLPLPEGEGGVRGNEANSNPRRTTITGAGKLHEPPAKPRVYQFGYEGQ